MFRHAERANGSDGTAVHPRRTHRWKHFECRSGTTYILASSRTRSWPSLKRVTLSFFSDLLKCESTLPLLYSCSSARVGNTLILAFIICAICSCFSPDDDGGIFGQTGEVGIVVQSIPGEHRRQLRVRDADLRFVAEQGGRGHGLVPYL